MPVSTTLSVPIRKSHPLIEPIAHLRAAVVRLEEKLQ